MSIRSKKNRLPLYLFFFCLFLTAKMFSLAADSGNINAIQTIKWKFKAIGIVRGIAIDYENNKIYFGSADRFLYCLNSAGNLQWKYDSGGNIHRVACDKNRGQIYFRSKPGCQYLCCISSEGEFLWEYQIGNIHGIDIDPYTGNIYCIRQANALVLCLSPSGDLIWKTEAFEGSAGGLALDFKRNLIYCSTLGKFLCLDYNGDTKWTRNLKGVEDIAVDSQTGNIYCASRQGYICCLDQNGSCKWTCQTENINGAIALDEKRRKLYCSVTGCGIYCFSLSGKLLDKYKIENTEQWASVAVNSRTGNVYCGSKDGYLYCLPQFRNNLIDEINSLRKENSQLEERIKKLEDIIGVDIE